MTQQVEQALDASIVHWEEIVAWLIDWYAENEGEPDMDFGDVPSDIGWNVANCALCQLFNCIPFQANNCRDCPLTKENDCCKNHASTFSAFDDEPTIANGEAMVAKLKQLKEGK